MLVEKKWNTFYIILLMYKVQNKIILLRDAHMGGNTIKKSMTIITIKFRLRLTSKVRFTGLRGDIQEASGMPVMLIS